MALICSYNSTILKLGLYAPTSPRGDHIVAPLGPGPGSCFGLAALAFGAMLETRGTTGGGGRGLGLGLGLVAETVEKGWNMGGLR